MTGRATARAERGLFIPIPIDAGETIMYKKEADKDYKTMKA